MVENLLGKREAISLSDVQPFSRNAGVVENLPKFTREDIFLGDVWPFSHNAGVVENLPKQAQTERSSPSVLRARLAATPRWQRACSQEGKQ